MSNTHYNKAEVTAAMDRFIRLSDDVYQSHAYSSGYFSGVILVLLANASEEDRQYVMESVNSQIQQFENRG